jgi:hypothetical protein
MNDAGVVIDHPIGTRGQLSIHLVSGEIRLVATADDRVVVRTPRGSSLPDRVTVEAIDGSLTIHEKEFLGLSFGLGRRVVQLEVEAPATTEVAIDIASGWLDVQGLRGEQRYRLVSAESRLRAVAGQIQLNTVSGDATLELADSTELTIRSISGDVAVRGGRLDGLRIGTTSGDVRVDSPLVDRTGNSIETLSGNVALVATAGMRVEARTVSGDLTSDLPHRSEGRMGRRTLIVGDGSIELGFRSVSGDLRIHDGSQPIPADPSFASSVHSAQSVPEAPAAPPAPIAPSDDDPVDPREAERMAILWALEQGDLDVPAAMGRLAALDGDRSEADAERGEPDV